MSNGYQAAIIKIIRAYNVYTLPLYAATPRLHRGMSQLDNEKLTEEGGKDIFRRFHGVLQAFYWTRQQA